MVIDSSNVNDSHLSEEKCKVNISNVDVYGAYSKHLSLGKKQASSYGGTYWTPCPMCGGKDRFCVWPYRDREDGPTHWCRQCGTSGDVISFIEYVEGLDFIEACESLGIVLGFSTTGAPRKRRRVDDDVSPSDEWIVSAVAFAKECKAALWSEVGKNALAWLRARGLSDNTIRRAGLGYNPSTRWDEKENWALEFRQDIKKVWLPRGITIPWRVEGRLWKISIRRPDPEIVRDRERGVEHPAKYIAVAGGSNGIYGIDDFNHEKPTVILEGEFDKLILGQATHIANVLATGSTAKGRGEKWALLIAQSPIALISFNADEAGQKAAKEYWLKYLPHSLPWTPWANDVNAMHLEGQDLHEWLQIGINLACPRPIVESVVTQTLLEGCEECCSCHRIIPSFEGWEPENIPVDAPEACFDPVDGKLYCKQCRPSLFGDSSPVEPVVAQDIAQWNTSTSRKSSLPPWLIPGTQDWDKLIARVGVKEAKERRQAALREY